MKKTITYLLLSFYLLAAFKPYLPVMNYVMNYDFYKNVLCENKAIPELKCNGKCHLAKEIKASQEHNNDTKLPIPKLDLSKLPVCLIENYTSFKTLVLYVKSKSFYMYRNDKKILVSLNVLTPPPDRL